MKNEQGKNKGSITIFALLSVYLAVKLNNSLPPVEDLKGEN